MAAISSISNKKIASYEIIYGRELRLELFNLIVEDYPEFNVDSVISITELNIYRRKYLTQLFEQEQGVLDVNNTEVINAIVNDKVLSSLEDKESTPTIGQRFADKIAEFGGSWTFIIIFFSFLLVWMAINIWVFTAKPFDPYPFILLNLILSCLAAVQAPIIMMSQNRQEQKDRLRAEHDYKINLKAELEIKLLHDKIDNLLLYQNKRLMEIQEMQIEYLETLIKQQNQSNSKQ